MYSCSVEYEICSINQYSNCFVVQIFITLYERNINLALINVQLSLFFSFFYENAIVKERLRILFNALLQRSQKHSATCVTINAVNSTPFSLSLQPLTAFAGLSYGWRDFAKTEGRKTERKGRTCRRWGGGWVKTF